MSGSGASTADLQVCSNEQKRGSLRSPFAIILGNFFGRLVRAIDYGTREKREDID